MSQRIVIKDNQFPYHIVARTNSRDFYLLDKTMVWRIYLKAIERCRKNYNLKLHAFVLMDNHFHMLASTPDSNIDKIMLIFMRETAKQINFLAKRSNHLYGSRYQASLITDEKYYALAYRYVYRNPIEAQISSSALSYPFTTLVSDIGRAKFEIKLDNTNFIFSDFHETHIHKRLAWIEQKNTLGVRTHIRTSLKHPEMFVAEKRSKNVLKFYNSFQENYPA